MKVDLFDFELPQDRIALRPVTPRDAAKLLVVDGDAPFADRHVRDLPDLLRAGDIFVLNDTRVIPARLEGERVREGASGAAIGATLHKRIDAQGGTTAELNARELPVPTPIAARVRRSGVGYTADIITGYIEDSRSFETMLYEGGVCLESWNLVGSTLRRFHDYGVDHSDLNVRNILVDGAQRVWFIDFDKGELRESGSWQNANLSRLKRSLRKVALESGTDFDVEGWEALERGYQSNL